MIDIKNISKTFLLRSKTLTISCICCIFITILLIVSMYNLSINAKMSYINELRAQYGNCDIIVNHNNYTEISVEAIHQIKEFVEIDKLSAGYFNPEFQIQGNRVYLVGSDNGQLLKDRYHYTRDLGENEIILNSVLAGCLSRKIGDVITMNGVELRVSEIIEDRSGSAYSLTMAIVKQETIANLLGNSPGYNFLLIDVFNNASPKSIVNRIDNIDPSFSQLIVDSDNIYKASMEAFSKFLKALIVCVVIVSGLLLTSIMRRFIYKYKHDLAVIRAIGGSKDQVNSIFRYIILAINLAGCLSGFLTSILFNNILLNWFNDKLKLMEGEIHYYFIPSLFLTIVGFIIIVVVLQFSISNSLNILPLEAFLQNELSHLGKNKKPILIKNLLWATKLLGRDGYITLKLILTRLKENLLITSTIVMLVVIAFLGNGLGSLIQKNNDTYLKQEYLTDTVVTSSNIISYNEFKETYHLLQNTEGIQTSITLNTFSNPSFQGEVLDTMIADIDAMEQQGLFQNVGSEKNRIILNKELAKKYNVSVGSVIPILTAPEYYRTSNGLSLAVSEEPYEVLMYVSAILPIEKMHLGNAYIDIQCPEFISEYSAIHNMYISGDTHITEQLLNYIKSIYPGIKWQTYANAVEMSKKMGQERFIIFKVVVGILSLIAGIGWFHAIKYSILSRIDEYNILRIHGMTIRRLRKVLFIHVLVFMGIGILSGVLIGSLFISCLAYSDSRTSIVSLDMRSFLMIVCYLLILCMFLVPSILKISKAKILTNE